MAKILIADDVSEECAKVLRAGELEVDARGKMKPDDVKAILGGYDGLVVRSGIKVTKDIIEAGAKLKVIGRAGIGVDNIDVDAASRRGVIVMNAPLGNVTSAAEHAFAMMLASARNIARGDRSLRAGKWERNSMIGVELEGKTLGICGLGKVGSQIAAYAKAFRMRVVAYDPLLVKERAEVLGVELVEFDRLLEEADFVTVHVPLTEKTRDMFDARAFKKMRKTARLINNSRGGIVNEKALHEALANHEIAGAALDVFEKEPPAPDLPLLKDETTTLTPHLGASTEEAQLRVSVDIAEQFVQYFKYGVVKNAVNLSSVADPTMAPYMRLGEDLGSFCFQQLGGRVRQVEVTYMGQIATFDFGAITQSVLKGVIAPAVGGDEVNAVNARFYARERGINVIENRRKDAKNYKSMMQVRIDTESGSRTMAGTVFEGGQPRIVQVDAFDIDLKPSKHMLTMTYPDVPGMVGRIGSILGGHRINIARMEVGRSGRGQQAMILLSLDDPVPPAVIDEIRTQVQVSDIKAITLA